VPRDLSRCWTQRAQYQRYKTPPRLLAGHNAKRKQSLLDPIAQDYAAQPRVRALAATAYDPRKVYLDPAERVRFFHGTRADQVQSFLDSGIAVVGEGASVNELWPDQVAFYMSNSIRHAATAALWAKPEVIERPNPLVVLAFELPVGVVQGDKEMLSEWGASHRSWPCATESELREFSKVRRTRECRLLGSLRTVLRVQLAPRRRARGGHHARSAGLPRQCAACSHLQSALLLLLLAAQPHSAGPTWCPQQREQRAAVATASLLAAALRSFDARRHRGT
jgi:hypothetical protein